MSQQFHRIHDNRAWINFLLLRFVPHNTDVGLLTLRLLVGMSLFLKHGWEKPTTFAMMAAHFPDPIHIGAVPSLVFALVSDAICSVLVMLGLATRWAALIVVINVGAAWSLVHHFIFFARPQGDHGELCFLYISAFLALFFAGAGRYSLDELITKGAQARL
jgi:putative oxidoreductase